MNKCFMIVCKIVDYLHFPTPANMQVLLAFFHYLHFHASHSENEVARLRRSKLLTLDEICMVKETI